MTIYKVSADITPIHAPTADRVTREEIEMLLGYIVPQIEIPGFRISNLKVEKRE